ncbi:MAG: glycine cleavage system protein H [Candidatus Marinimicrobia bacterium]|nr:glycine cleavage system protein H [Candidatus Neomarinimicrobiota bacterium]|tara:strand:- start:1224 stop:1601 length:378 start_codon:yes stop_codon:yes gene_type:complete
MDTPDNLSYTKEHEWISIEDNIAIVGISDYAQSELGDIVFVEMPNIDDVFDKNDVFGTIEAVKTLADLFLPVSGKIIEINESLESNPELVNSSPYNDGWLVKIEVKDVAELEDLLNSEDYKKLIS